MIIKASDTNSKMIMVPFLIFALASTGKTLCFILEKENLATVFDKLFVMSFFLFWFGFLFFWCYITLKEKNIVFLFFSIPFWFIGIHYLRKFLWKKEKDHSRKKKKILKWNLKIIVGVFLIGFTLCSGIVMLVFGIKDTYQLNHKTKNYMSITAYFKDYQIYDQNNDGDVTY